MLKPSTHVWTLALLTVFVLAVLSLSPVYPQANDSRTFPETGKAVSGKFLDYWNAHGGLAQQGYPISDPMQEKSETDGKTYSVQYFERAVFEDHPENQPPGDVLLSLLGSFLYKQKYPTGAPEQTVSTTNPRFFSETGKTLGGRFREYWEQNGGLAQQGYPISNEFQEVSELDGKAYTVQYFQRAVFELHAANQPPYDVLLSQLGKFRYNAKYLAPAPTPTQAVLADFSEVPPPAEDGADHRIWKEGRTEYRHTAGIDDELVTIGSVHIGGIVQGRGPNVVYKGEAFPSVYFRIDGPWGNATIKAVFLSGRSMTMDPTRGYSPSFSLVEAQCHNASDANHSDYGLAELYNPGSVAKMPSVGSNPNNYDIAEGDELAMRLSNAKGTQYSFASDKLGETVRFFAQHPNELIFVDGIVEPK